MFSFLWFGDLHTKGVKVLDLHFIHLSLSIHTGINYVYFLNATDEGNHA